MSTDTKRAVERMREELRYADHYRNRSKALDWLAMLLDCETPGTVSAVAVRGKRWWHWNRDKAESEPKEIVLTDDERREFAAWCKERAADYKKRADSTEARYATGKESS